MPDYPLTFPPVLKDIFTKLSSGYHVCIEDGDIYSSLAEHSDYYRNLFDLLGYRLSNGMNGIYYFLPTDQKINNLSKKFTAFMAIMYDWLADQGKEPVTSLTEEHFYLSELPHLTIEQYKKIMGQLDVKDEKELQKIVTGLHKHGFLLLVDGSLIKFRKTVIRFVNIFTEVGEAAEGREASGEEHE